MSLNFFQILFFCYIYIFAIPSSRSYEPKQLKDIIALTVKCINSGSKQLCTEGLDVTKEYKFYSGHSNNYPCQTRLLAIEANLIMGMNKTAKKTRAYKIIKEAKRFCKS